MCKELNKDLITERIENYLDENGISYGEIGMLVWHTNENSVDVHLDGYGFLGTFDYETNSFVASKMRNNNFVDFVGHWEPNRQLKLSVYPTTGWFFELHAYMTDIVYDEKSNTIYISNAFSNEKPKLTIQNIVKELEKFNDDAIIVFEIYSIDKEGVNNQIISTPIYRDKSDEEFEFALSLSGSESYVTFSIGMEKVDLSLYFKGE